MKIPISSSKKNSLRSQGKLAVGLDGGFYAGYLKNWYDVFEKESIKIVFHDYLAESPLELIGEIYQWLSLDARLPSAVPVENKGFYYRNGFIHNLAIKFNRKLEPFFRKKPFLKSIARNIYKLNAKENPFSPEQTTLKYLEELYSPHNVELYDLLRSKGYSSEDIPDWAKNDNFLGSS